MQIEELTESLLPLFAEGGRFYGRYSLPASTDPELAPKEIVGGALWELPIHPSGSQSYELMRVYAFHSSMGQLLQAHWRNEARALLRLSTRSHRSLPKFREADLISQRELGYVIVAQTGTALAANPPALEALTKDRRQAFLAFYGIVEAVAAMHEEGLLHRNLSLHALRVGEDLNPLVVDEFQMSSFVSAWFRGRAPSTFAGLAPPDRLGRWMLAPERLATLEGNRLRDIETYATDVFGLGMVGLAIFGVRLDPPTESYSPEAHRRWIENQRGRLRETELPLTLQRALEAMTEVDRRNRIASGTALHEELSKSYGAILFDLEWQASRSDERFELLYLSESVKRIYDDGRGQSHPSDPEYTEYNGIIAQDLVNGVLTWSPDGFEPWERTGDRKTAKQARVVLLGRAYAYFCAYLDAGRGGEDRERLVVKHMLPLDRASSLRRIPYQRSVPRVECAHFSPGPRRPARIHGTTGWSALVDTVRHDGGRSVHEPVVATARWLIDAQWADLRRRWYLVEKVAVDGDTIQLREADASASPLDDPSGAFDHLWALAGDRPAMSEAFGGEARRALDADELQKFVVRERRDARETIAELRLDKILDRHTCQFRIVNQVAPLPQTAWVMPDDLGTRAGLRRQLEAVLELEHRYGHLAAQLRHPRAFRIPAESINRAEKVNTELASLVRRIHETWPIFSLQGPPGTGKTYLASELVQQILTDDPFARVLVSAQSHHALDNLLEGVVGRLPDVATLRIASERTRDRVHKLAKDHTLQARVDALIDKIARSSQLPGPEFARGIVAEWRNRAKGKHVELRADVARRLPRASSVVFATSGQSTPDALGGARGAGAFDWVIVEEAARGWLTEFLVALVHGARWCLFGDQAQLAAHRQQDFERLLQRDIDDNVTGRFTGVSPNKEWKNYLSYFAHLMAAGGDEQREPPRERLRVQRRMHPDVAGLVAASFYSNALTTDATAARPHGLTPSPFSGTALVWLDTSGLGPHAYETSEGGVRNLCEAHVLSYFFRNRVGDPPRFNDRIDPLAVLSPYKAQVRLLSETLKYPKEVIHTVDSFQGREAEVVLVSLVRNNAAEHTDKAIGFLTEPSRVNVMFSRARRLLVIVGAAQHFERHAGTSFWSTVVGYVRSDPRFLLDVAQEGFAWTRGGRT